MGSQRVRQDRTTFTFTFTEKRLISGLPEAETGRGENGIQHHRGGDETLSYWGFVVNVGLMSQRGTV